MLKLLYISFAHKKNLYFVYFSDSDDDFYTKVGEKTAALLMSCVGDIKMKKKNWPK